MTYKIYYTNGEEFTSRYTTETAAKAEASRNKNWRRGNVTVLEVETGREFVKEISRLHGIYSWEKWKEVKA